MDNNGITIMENSNELRDKYHKRYWGRKDILMTDKQVKALLDGKCLMLNDGEYSFSIRIVE